MIDFLGKEKKNISYRGLSGCYERYHESCFRLGIVKEVNNRRKNLRSVLIPPIKFILEKIKLLKD